MLARIAHEGRMGRLAAPDRPAMPLPRRARIRTTPASATPAAAASGWPAEAAPLLAALALANLLVWALALAAFGAEPALLGAALLAYGLGLRHAMDADHIAAIDNVARKLIQRGRPASAVGFYFSLGHSTIVFLLSLLVALAATGARGRLHALRLWGDTAGTLVSAGFLLALAASNLAVLVALLRTRRRLRAGTAGADAELDRLLARRGLLGRLFRGLFALVGRSPQMYFVGFLFGLGFDTASEIGLLGLSAAGAAKALPIWQVMLFPALFAAGMALLDTLDSAMMAGAYGWAFAQPLRKLSYNITVTSLSVAVALGVGSLEALGLLGAPRHPSGAAWRVVGALNGHFGALGLAI
ncbi:MAG: HoxN/HupN/NixA family nickel/cobalt transporter, partial [Acetobacteraceae bacterium]